MCVLQSKHSLVSDAESVRNDSKKRAPETLQQFLVSGSSQLLFVSLTLLDIYNPAGLLRDSGTLERPPALFSLVKAALLVVNGNDSLPFSDAALTCPAVRLFFLYGLSPLCSILIFHLTVAGKV